MFISCEIHSSDKGLIMFLVNCFRLLEEGLFSNLPQKKQVLVLGT